MRAIDTNLLIRIATRDHEGQARAAENFIGGGAWVSHVVLAEAVWVLVSLYGLPRSALADILAKLLKQVDVVIQDAEVVEAALGLYKENKKVEFADCLILEIARKAGHAPLGTFDRAFAKMAGVELVS